MGCCCSQLQRKVAEKFSENEIISKEIGWANLQALTTQGGCLRKGNGGLVLTRDKLWFRFICCGDDELEIPLNDITKVYEASSLRFRGRYIRTFSKMLVIEFSANTELVAFALPGPEIWVRLIEETKNSQLSAGLQPGSQF
eukprot:Seg2861.2 transcript_id=Seg2861.2/GoldUCD/mRNA.D3Y31 product="hypothetical protein" protein_id=Seg2861.2/GoldUCD/D3Y31